VLGEFDVERHLGAGGFGQVDLVRSRWTGQQYAVKRILLDDPAARGQFLTEAQRWIGLPAHDNIVTCHFVRTTGQELTVFSEFVPGGSLADQMASGALLADDDPLRRIMDIAVQVAWGLDAAHVMGLLHLDVKPGNILLAKDGTAKITDFGLAATSERSTATITQMEAILDYIAGPDVDPSTHELLREAIRPVLFGPKADETIEGRAEGATAAYASLEQAERRAVGRGSDAWSWGLVVLEMFAGGRSWPSGTLAAPALERIARGTSPGRVPIPDFVCDLLRRCFQDDPANRPRSLREIATELVTGMETAGNPLRRQAPPRLSPADDPQPYRRVLASGARWDDPRRWLDFAYRSAGLDPEQAVRFWPSAGYTPRSMALADLGAFLEAVRVLEPVASHGTADLRLGLARLHAMIAMVRRSMGDQVTAIEGYRQAALIAETVDSDYAREVLTYILDSLSIALRGTGETSAAVGAADRAIQVARQLPDEPDARALLGGALQTKANAMPAGQERRDLMRQAVTEYERSGREEQVVRALADEASALALIGDTAEAEATWRQVQEKLDGLTASGERPDLMPVVGLLRLNMSQFAGFTPTGLAHASEAAAVLAQLVEKYGQYQLAGDLGSARFRLARNYEFAGRAQEAVDVYRSARLAFEQAVLRDGRTALASDLAEVYDHESTLLAILGNETEAVRLAERAVSMWQRITALADSDDSRYGLAEARVKLASTFRQAGKLPAARKHAQDALAVLASPAAPNDRIGIAHLARAHTELAAVERAEGDPGAAVRRLVTALGVLNDAPDPSDSDISEERAEVLIRIGNAMTDLQEFERAVSAFDESIEQALGTGGTGGTGGQPPTARARAKALDAAHGRINALIKYGDYQAAITAADDALGRYTALIAAGRTDLRGEQARLRLALGQARLLSADIPGAVATWGEAVSALAKSGTQANVAGAIAGQVEELTELLAAGPGDLPAQLEALRQGYERLTALSRSGQVQDVSVLLEVDLARGLHLLGISATDPLLNLCGEIGLSAGVLGMRAGRYVAAVRAFDIAGQCFMARYENYGRREGFDRWCDARSGMATVYLLNDAQDEAGRVVRETEAIVEDVDPRGADARMKRVRQVLAAVAPDNPSSEGSRD
jgi:serine/threonine protein kinase